MTIYIAYNFMIHRIFLRNLSIHLSDYMIP